MSENLSPDQSRDDSEEKMVQTSEVNWRSSSEFKPFFTGIGVATSV